MQFSTLEFIFRFLPLFFLCYSVMPERGRNFVLLLGSLVFYAVGEPVYIFLMMASILFNYGAARGIAFCQVRCKSRESRLIQSGVSGNGVCIGARIWLTVAVVIDLGVLFLFLFFFFFCNNLYMLVYLVGVTLLVG